MSREAFFRMPWSDFAESRVSSNFTHGNVFELRQRKLQIMQQVMGAAGAHRVRIAHLKNIEKDPEQFVEDLAARFHLEMNPGYQAQELLKPSEKKHTTLCLTLKEWQISVDEIDWELEGSFGFNYLDCHACVRR